MHFREKQGYEFINYDTYEFTNWYIRKIGDYSWKSISVATTYRSESLVANKYYFNNKTYSTTEMLKIIKLKAFL